MTDLIDVLNKYPDSRLADCTGAEYSYCDVVRLTRDYSRILSESGGKSAVLIESDCSSVHALAAVIACFNANGVAVMLPRCSIEEKQALSGEYPHDCVLTGRTLKRTDRSLPKNAYPESVNLILFSSGTNGKMRGVMLTAENMIGNVEAGMRHFPVAPKSNIVNILPLFHAYGLNVATLALLYNGCNIFFADGMTYLKAVERIEPTYFFLTPEIVETHRKIQGVKGFAASWGKNAKYVFCGGDFIGASLREYLGENGIELFCSYGLTEASPSVSAETFGLKRTGSVGKPIEGVNVEIAENEIVVSGSNVACGYYDEWAESGRVRNECLYTGDLGYVDSDGFLFVTGRKKNLMVFGDGRKLTAEHIEQSVKNILGAIQIRVYENARGTAVAEYYGKYKESDVRAALGKILSPHQASFEIVKRSEPMRLTFSGKIKRG